jgi:pSer/pThr/pTyr-binding forkhead associated (FHA) protein
MTLRTTLLAIGGVLKGLEFAFEGDACCLVGRSPSCDMLLPSVPGYPDVSRRHCMFEFEATPPRAWVGDLGSLNGTFVNGAKIGGRRRGDQPVNRRTTPFHRVELHDGDEVRICNHVFQVHMDVPSEVSNQAPLPSESSVPARQPS